MAIFLTSLACYHAAGASWWLFVVLFFVPDLSMLGYAVNARIGALVYNLGHAYIVPALIAIAGILLGLPVMVSCAIIWFGHIGFDRMFGFGLKSVDGFKVTHLGTMSRQTLSTS
ncbi:DUF4260 domain-containing protein [Breoghania sp.]|uniref:DUF4260 domain-containing protein n=1 Tax=Breoghania sp. TaxID=2065378 RepID=UPI0026294982|nr:DUF4260 domain-containing protein [Breoghania sp.]MDJ0931382.1 DUF4260 domain-containing protein [Breoghania sp.]